MRGAPPASLAALTPDAWTEPFWVAAREHRLVVPRCTTCGAFRLPPSPFCWSCRASDVDWVEQPPRGTLYSFTVIRHAVIADVADAVPYVVGVVELPEAPGARLVANVVECDPADVAIGMPLDLVWDDVADDVAIARFRPA